MNLPNSLSLFRIVLGFIVPIMMVTDDFWLRVCAAILFAVAAFTDWFDGWYARRYNLVTKLGKILDPIADKIIVLGSFIVLSSATTINMYSIWWVIPIFVREVGITVYRLAFLLKEKPLVVPATWSGKAKTVTQMVTLPFAYFCFMLDYYPQGDPIGKPMVLYWIMYFMLIASVVFTLFSGYRFFEKNWKEI